MFQLYLFLKKTYWSNITPVSNALEFALQDYSKDDIKNLKQYARELVEFLDKY